MRLNEVIDSLSENEYVQEALYEVSDALFLHNLLDMRQRFINDYIAVKDGQDRSVFVLNNREQDAFEIRRRIEAADLLIEQFKPNHVPLDFDGFPWFDDEEYEDE